MHVSEGELKEFIIDSYLVAKKDIDAADEEAKKRKQSLGDILVSRGHLTEDALRRIQAYVLGIPFVNLKEHRIPIDVLALIPEPIARTHNIIAFKKENDSLEVAMLDVEDLASIDSMRKRQGSKYSRGSPTPTALSTRSCSIRSHSRTSLATSSLLKRARYA